MTKTEIETHFTTNYPEVRNIADRLEYSEITSAKTNDGRRNGKGVHKSVVKNPDDYIIAEYYKDGRWIRTASAASSGKDNFVMDLFSLYNTREPDAIRVELYNGKKRENRKPSDVVIVPFNENGRNEKESITADKELEKLANTYSEPVPTEAQIEKIGAQIGEHIDKLRELVQACNELPLPKSVSITFTF